MDFWTLIVAAGSAYAFKHLQTQQKQPPHSHCGSGNGSNSSALRSFSETAMPISDSKSGNARARCEIFGGFFDAAAAASFESPPPTPDVARVEFSGEKRYRNRALSLRVNNNRPMSSLESCLVAQLTPRSLPWREGQGLDEPVPSAMFASPALQSFRRPLVVSDGSCIVNPLLLQRPGANPRLSVDFADPSASKMDDGICLLRSRFPPLPRLDLGEGSKGAKATSIGNVAFSFGIGVGIMHAAMSNRKETERLNVLLRQSENLVEDLEEEIKIRDSLIVKDITSASHDPLETRQFPLVYHGPNEPDKPLNEVWVNTHGRDSAKQKEMADVEAELAAELEILEINLTSKNHQQGHPYISEIDPECIAEVVHGELKGDGLIGNEHSEKDSDASKHEELRTGNYAVSPRALASRLHEVLESRLQERILELEMELEAAKNRLQKIEADDQNAKNRDTHMQGKRQRYWDDRSASVSEDMFEASSMLQKDCIETAHCINLGDCSENQCRETEVSHTESIDKQYRNSKSTYSQSPLFVTLSGDALSAYNEACNEFKKVASGDAISASAGLKDFLDEMQPSEANSSFFQNANHKERGRENTETTSSPFFDRNVQLKDIGALHLEADLRQSMRLHSAMASHQDYTHGSYSSSGLESLPSPKKNEPHLEGNASKISDFPYYGVEDSFESTPCSDKSVDTSDHIKSYYDKGIYSWRQVMEPRKLDENENTMCGSSSPSGVCANEGLKFQRSSVNLIHLEQDGNTPTICGLPEVNQSVIQKIESWNKVAEKEEPKLDKSKTVHNVIDPPVTGAESPTYNPIADEFDYTPKVDEELGNWLIDRIIEKRKKGSSLLQQAEIMLALLEENDMNKS